MTRTPLSSISQNTTPGITIEAIVRECHGIVVNNHAEAVSTISVCGISAFDETYSDTISFSAESSGSKLKDLLPHLSCSVLMVKENITDIELLSTLQSPIIIAVNDPYKCIIALIPKLYKPATLPSDISPLAVVHPSAYIAKNVAISPFCVIGKNVEISEGTVLFPHVVIYEEVKIGKGCTIHAGAVIRERCVIGDSLVIQSGAVIGSDGFGYYQDSEKGLISIPQIGTVVLEHQVDVGANTCIDRATFGTTKVARGSKIDNLVQIGHNNKIGSHTILCGQVGIAGSCQIGNQVVIGGAAKVADHVAITDGVRIGGGSLVRVSITEKGDYAGDGPLPKGQWLRVSALIKDLPRLLKTKKIPLTKD